ncbi:TPA: type IV toxin-antitoxin system AbiEi family antitoxin domain-containing protein, partial [Legionella pneumophila]|nr:type IV toxin-antitoxin system AbiEi family antitoxin domain-containing protein [Legionella pneumophila]
TYTKLANIKSLLRKPVFTSKEANELGMSPSLLCYYVQKDIIHRVSKGLYQAVYVKKEFDFRWEDLIFTLRSISQGVICLVSALAIYELTDEMPRKHWIAVPHSTTKPMRPNTIVKRMRDVSTGLTTWNVDGESVPIFDMERTIIDAFRFLSKEIALKALQTGLREKHIDSRKLQRYAKKLRVDVTPYLLAMTI